VHALGHPEAFPVSSLDSPGGKHKDTDVARVHRLKVLGLPGKDVQCDMSAERVTSVIAPEEVRPVVLHAERGYPYVSPCSGLLKSRIVGWRRGWY
jgi:hypothetical protein